MRSQARFRFLAFGRGWVRVILLYRKGRSFKPFSSSQCRGSASFHLLPASWQTFSSWRYSSELVGPSWSDMCSLFQKKNVLSSISAMPSHCRTVACRLGMGFSKYLLCQSMRALYRRSIMKETARHPGCRRNHPQSRTEMHGASRTR